MSLRLKLARLLLSFTLVMSATTAAHADLRLERKLFQYGGPETRTRCIGQLKTKGVPKCRTRGIKIYCSDTWISTCSEWATDFKQHAFYLVVRGPNAEKALERLIVGAIEIGLVAAVAAAAATPGEVVIRLNAAIAAFDIAFTAELARQPAVAALKNQYKISVRSRNFW